MTCSTSDVAPSCSSASSRSRESSAILSVASMAEAGRGKHSPRYCYGPNVLERCTALPRRFIASRG